jgi:hypothetical protein
MTRNELLAYMLENREDDEAFYVLWTSLTLNPSQKYIRHRNQLMT